MYYNITDKVIKVFLPYTQKEKLWDCGSTMWSPTERCYYAPRSLEFIHAFKSKFELSDPLLDELYEKVYNEIVYRNSVIAYYKYLRENPKEPVPEPVLSFKYKTYKPYRHQQLSLYVSLLLGNFGLLLEPGTGKSRIIIDTICHRVAHGEVKSVLILCPKVNIVNTWVPQFETHATQDIKIVPIYKGTSKKKKELITNRPNVPFVHLMSYELMSKNVALLEPYDLVVYDESRRLGDSESKRSFSSFNLALNAKYVLIATGTVNTLSTFKDVFSQYKVMDLGQSFGLNYYSFREKYFTDVGINFPDWRVKPGSLEVIRDIMYNKAVTYKKEECLDLSGQVFKYIHLEPRPEQLKFYNEVVDSNLSDWVDKEFKLDHLEENSAFKEYAKLGKITKLSEVTSGYYKPITDPDNIVTFSTIKLPTVLDIIEKIGNEKLVVWVRFNHDVNNVVKTLESKGVGCCRLTGKFDEIEKWVDSVDHNVLVANETMGIGLNDLIIARYVVYYSYDYSLDHWKQSLDRVYRIGQTRKVTYFILSINKTVDVGIIYALRHNERISKNLTKYQFSRLIKGESYTK
jgi:SNF2 family DNA or RNA helicase